MANNFSKPTDVQAHSLVHLQSKIDMIIAAKTGQGKTLCFGLPILDQLVKKIRRELDKMADNSDSDKQEPKQVFDSCKALIISPTRELAMQIRDMISAVIPVDYQ